MSGLRLRRRNVHHDTHRFTSRSGKKWVAGAAVLAALSGAAIFNHLRARRAERQTPPAGRFVTIGGVRLHYVERGNGPPLVLLHGNGATLEDMTSSGLVDRLAERYRVIAFDRPGFGYSDRPRTRVWTPEAQADLLAAALARLGIGPAVVIGHSWGTLVTLALALDHPMAVRSAVLLSGYYFPTLRADVPMLSGPAVPVVGDVLSHTVSPLLGRAMAPALVRRIFSPAPVAATFARFPLELSLRPSQVRASAADTALMIPGAATLSRRYSELRTPLMIVAGDGDKIVDFERQSVRLHGSVPGSELRILSGAGHMIHHTAPDMVVEAIDAAAHRAAA